jgi:predicted kinase
MQKLIILRGAGGSGKSTIAQSLRNFKKKVVWLKVDGFKGFFAEDASNALEYVHGSAISTLKYLLSQGFSVIMEGIFRDPKYITQSVEIAKQKSVLFKVYELECSLNTLQTRDKERPLVKQGWRKPLGDKVIARLHKNVEENPWKGANKLNTEKMSLKECIEKLNKELKS